MSSQPFDIANRPIAVIGAGAWGTALAVLLVRAGEPTVLCARRAAHLEELKRGRENRNYLPGILLPDELVLAAPSLEVIRQAGAIVMAIPSCYARATIAPLAASIRPHAPIISAAKGVEEGSSKTMTQMIEELVGGRERMAALSGPGFAAEVARGKPAALVGASSNPELAHYVQKTFSIHQLRIYRSPDVIGVELAGAVKNVIAIAAGISDGLGLGSGARAAVITRGLAELMRLVAAAGGRRETAAGLAGLGDLVLTCTGDLSRNRALGLQLGGGRKPEELRIAGDGKPVAEGLTNCRSIAALAHRLGVEMPIASAVRRSLYENAAPEAIVEELLSRELKAEF